MQYPNDQIQDEQSSSMLHRDSGAQPDITIKTEDLEDRLAQARKTDLRMRQAVSSESQVFRYMGYSAEELV